jgi:hypothetical protein
MDCEAYRNSGRHDASYERHEFDHVNDLQRVSASVCILSFWNSRTLGIVGSQGARQETGSQSERGCAFAGLEPGGSLVYNEGPVRLCMNRDFPPTLTATAYDFLNRMNSFAIAAIYPMKCVARVRFRALRTRN